MYVHMYIHASCISSQAFFREDISQFLDLQEFPQYTYIYIFSICMYIYIYTYLWKAARHSKFGLDRVFTTPKMCNFPHFWTCRSFGNIQTIMFFHFWTCSHRHNTRTIHFPHFWTCTCQILPFSDFLKQLRMPRNIFSYFGKRHSKLSSVKTKTIHFSPFFEFRDFPQHPNYPSFPYFLNSESSHNTQIINFPHFLHSESSHNTQTFIPYSISALDFCEKMDCTRIYIYMMCKYE